MAVCYLLMAHIGIDCRFSGSHAGIGRTTRELVTNMLALPSDHTFTLFVRSSAEPWLMFLPKTTRIVTCDAAHYSFAEQRAIPALLRREQCDFLFAPHFNVPLRCPVPFVCVIHDTILHAYPNRASFVKRMAYRIVFRHAVRRAKALVTVSNAVMREVNAMYHIPQERFTTIYPGVAGDFHARSEQEVNDILSRRGIVQPYLLYVGAAKEHKRVDALLEAFTRLHDPSVRLVLVSGGKEAEQLTLPEGAMIVQGISDDELAALYTGAACFVSASLYEGFGLPFAEAMACGCPVVGINRGSIPEVVNGFGTLSEPDTEALTQALRTALARKLSSSDIEKLISHGRSYRWDAAGYRLLTLLSQVTGV